MPLLVDILLVSFQEKKSAKRRIKSMTIEYFGLSVKKVINSSKTNAGLL